MASVISNNSSVKNVFYNLGRKNYNDFVLSFQQNNNNTEIVNDEGWTPLIAASYYGVSDAVKFLLSLNADIRKTI